MPSAALVSLKNAIEQLDKEREAVRERLEQLDLSLDSLRKSYNVLVALERTQPVENVEPTVKVRRPIRLKQSILQKNGRSSDNPDKREVAAKVAAILMDSDRPMLRSDILEKLKDMGVVINGKDPEMVLSTMLWRVGSEFCIENEKGKGYFIEGKDYGVFG